MRISFFSSYDNVVNGLFRGFQHFDDVRLLPSFLFLLFLHISVGFLTLENNLQINDNQTNLKKGEFIYINQNVPYNKMKLISIIKES